TPSYTKSVSWQHHQKSNGKIAQPFNQVGTAKSKLLAPLAGARRPLFQTLDGKVTDRGISYDQLL
ncbi:TPA: hypothetical protein ACR6V4_005870, partial [Klebsiella pneumoniae]